MEQCGTVANDYCEYFINGCLLQEPWPVQILALPSLSNRWVDFSNELSYDGRQLVIFRTDIHDDNFFDNFLFLELRLAALILRCDGDVVRLAENCMKMIRTVFHFVG